MNLGSNLRNARKEANMKQTELADKLGVKQRDISRWENNEVVPTTITFANICKALNASADEILELK